MIGLVAGLVIVLTLVGLPVGMVLLALARRAANLPDDRCPVCAYSLKGAASDRCSECGAIVRQELWKRQQTGRRLRVMGIWAIAVCSVSIVALIGMIFLGVAAFRVFLGP